MGNAEGTALFVAALLLVVTIGLIFVSGVNWLAVIPAASLLVAMLWAGGVFDNGRTHRGRP